MKFGKLRSFTPTSPKHKVESLTLTTDDGRQVKLGPGTLQWGDAHTITLDRGPDPALKGKKDGNCNRSACQEPGAYFYNTATRAYYCIACARDIRRWGLMDGFDLFPEFDAELERARAKERARH